MLWLPPNMSKDVYLMSSIIVEVLIIAFVDENIRHSHVDLGR